jgi:hypothetical protein
MTLRIRSMLRRAFLALPFQMRQRRHSTSSTISALACSRPGAEADAQQDQVALVALRRLKITHANRLEAALLVEMRLDLGMGAARLVQ